MAESVVRLTPEAWDASKPLAEPIPHHVMMGMWPLFGAVVLGNLTTTAVLGAIYWLLHN